MTRCVLFTPGLLTTVFNGPRKLESLVWDGAPIPKPAGIGFAIRRGGGIFNLCAGYANTQGTSIFLSPDWLGLCGQPKHVACHLTQESNQSRGKHAYP